MLSSTGLVSFNLLTSNAVVTPTKVPGYINSSQGDLGTDGWFYITDSVSNDLWAVEWAATNSAAKRVGKLLTAAGLPVQLHGGDCGFAFDGTLCLWSNWPMDSDAPRGLYKFRVPATSDWPTNLTAIFEPCHGFLTGMAVSKTGEQTMVASTWPDSTVIQFSSSNAQVSAILPMLLNGHPYSHTGGDMAVGVYSNGDSTERFFLGEDTNLFEVTLTATNAELTQLAGLPFGTDPIGASPSVPGELLILSSPTSLVSYSLQSNTYTVTEVAVPADVIYAQGDLGPDNRFYITDITSNGLWTIDRSDTNRPIPAQKVGRLTTAAGLPVSVQGADMAFASNGVLCLWSNWPESENAPRGLYKFQVPPTNAWPADLAAIEEPAHLLINGLAISKTGQQSIVVSTWIDSTIVQLNPGNAQVTSTLPMYRDGRPYSHLGGDMAIAMSTNGTPFSWLASFGLGNGGWNRAAMADQDGDGMAAWKEYIAGTDPTNPFSILLVTSVADATASGFVVQWPSVADRTYELDRTTNLTLNAFEVIAVDLPATPPMNVYTDVVEGLDRALYRIKARLR
jgi:hypothetical protein